MTAKRKCVVNTACGRPRGEARWWFGMGEGTRDQMLKPLFAPIEGPVVFGAACCDECKDEIEIRSVWKDETDGGV